jgi:nucleotide-binding universal stress UspA family protein
VIVVGVSPTTGSPNALRWAAAEAQLRNLPLRAVMAWRAPRPPGASGMRPPATPAVASDDYGRDADERLRGFVAGALGADTNVECVVVHGSEVNALLSSARGAQLLVIGEPQPGRLASMMSSLTAPHVVLKAECPVVVMPSAVALSTA